MLGFKEKIGFSQGDHLTHPDEGREIHSEENRLIFPEQLPTLKETEQMVIDEALRRANGNQTIAAELLGLSRRALNNRLNRTDRNDEK